MGTVETKRDVVASLGPCAGDVGWASVGCGIVAGREGYGQRRGHASRGT